MLYIVATPIGNLGDITQRACQILSECDYLICESIKIGKFWQRRYAKNAQLLLLNEHSSNQEIAQLAKLAAENIKLALISDCGTPVFQDPGENC